MADQSLPDSLLSSAFKKLVRASEAFQNLHNEIDGFIESKPYEIRHEYDSETDQRVLVYYPAGEIPAHWPVVLGEVLYNLRSALDHAVYELTILETGAPLEGTEFPVFSKEEIYFQRKGNGDPTKISGLYKIRGLSKRSQIYIESLQPFRLPKTNAYPSAIALLNELNVVDKHQELHICRRRYADASWTIVRDPPEFVDEVSILVGGDPNGRMELFRWRRPGFKPEEIDMAAEVRFDVAFDARSFRSLHEPQPIVLICEQLINSVKMILVQLLSYVQQRS